MKKSENCKDVTDVVLQITDGTSYDDVTLPSEQLRSKKTKVWITFLYHLQNFNQDIF